MVFCISWYSRGGEKRGILLTESRYAEWREECKRKLSDVDHVKCEILRITTQKLDLIKARINMGKHSYFLSVAFVRRFGSGSRSLSFLIVLLALPVRVSVAAIAPVAVVVRYHSKTIVRPNGVRSEAGVVLVVVVVSVAVVVRYHFQNVYGSPYLVSIDNHIYSPSL